MAAFAAFGSLSIWNVRMSQPLPSRTGFVPRVKGAAPGTISTVLANASPRV